MDLCLFRRRQLYFSFQVVMIEKKRSFDELARRVQLGICVYENRSEFCKKSKTENDKATDVDAT